MKSSFQPDAEIRRDPNHSKRLSLRSKGKTSPYHSLPADRLGVDCAEGWLERYAVRVCRTDVRQRQCHGHTCYPVKPRPPMGAIGLIDPTSERQRLVAVVEKTS